MKPEDVLKAEYKKRIEGCNLLMETAPDFTCALLALTLTIKLLQQLGKSTSEAIDEVEEIMKARKNQL